MSRYILSPAMADFIAQTLSFTATTPDINGMREAYSRMCRAFTPERPAGLDVTDLPLAEVPVRCYRPLGTAPANGWPCVVYLHGGGWVVGDLESHDFLTSALASDLGAVVIAVDYRLAPEFPFPAAFDDCLAVWRGIQQQASSLGVDVQRLAIAGDSAGGNLAAALCLTLRDSGEPQPKGQALLYPGLGGASDLPSRTECADAPLLSSNDVECYRALYLRHRDPEKLPYAMPLKASDFAALAPAFIAVAQYDPLRDDGVYYHQALTDAQVPSEFYLGAGLVHGCLRAKGKAEEVDALYETLLAALRKFLV
ncbi:alpha/beta hydrolase [Pseudomonas sp. CCI3.2]|uniref:alpha/beta hydrolase n=1 Tax=unclassified Pseudomonas TaxID=196821 RepID=UPI002AC9E736|nr:MULTISPECIES: alpha/beta hydrolase [unclassified Pseudomonas]MEB0076733.1 alpha/beta hydrolase [Pseudomonas sp. MH10out]MEB0101866.1 alpha/beta hydrolase [Pseudomonas sp. CCI3.2]MEB0131147.1 alpha/beta hydrolase [Pseudomonas sp. CCI2.4]MEB0157136.1 alpha/beta hydrolase [Pseudomonas sp. AH2 (2023)]MEB0167480.1 alpha/beta hydrolase [Pseudomonas sp. CCC4.4]